MYLPSSQQCNVPNGTTPIDPASYAAANAATDAQTLALANANAAWQQVLRRDWRSFQDLGPQVALQVLNAPIGSPSSAVFNGAAPPASAPTATGPASSSTTGLVLGGQAPSSPVGVLIVGSGSTAGSTPGAGQRHHQRTAKAAGGGKLNANQKAFVQTFGSQLRPYKTYTGPIPPQGSVLSLVYGGSPSNRTAAFGTSPPSMPDAAAGYYQGSASCFTPAGVSALPWGESAAAGGANGGAAAASSSNLWLWAIAGLVGLAWLSGSDRKK